MAKKGIRGAGLILALLALHAGCLPAHASAEITGAAETPEAAVCGTGLPTMEVAVGDALYPGEVFLSDGCAFVSLRQFAAFACPGLSEDAIGWDGEAASVNTALLSLRAEVGSRILEANGRMLWCAGEIVNLSGAVYVPLRPLSAAFGYVCTYDAAERRAELTRERAAIVPADLLGEGRGDALFWLSRLIEAEAGGEPFDGKLAVGAVVVNRAASDEFPDEIPAVIFDRENGVQFTPTENGTIEREPSAESVLAAKITLDNPPLWEGIRYFLNPAVAESLWIPSAREYAFTIGGHDFYR